MATRKFTDDVGELDSDRRARIDALKDEARANSVAFNLQELRQHRQLTQVKLVERINRVICDFPKLDFATRHGCEPWEDNDQANAQMVGMAQPQNYPAASLNAL